MSVKTWVLARFCVALRGRLTAVAAILATATIGLAFNCSTATAALVAYYPLNDNLNDASGNGNNGISGGAVVFAPGGGIVLNGSGHTQGTGAYFNAPVNINSFPQVTFGGWFEVAGTNPPNGMIVDDAGGFGRGLDIDTRSGNTGYSAFNGSGAFGGIAPSGPATFDFVAVTYNSGTNSETLDVNGTFVNSTGTPPSGDAFLTIGENYNFDNTFDGTIKNVFIYNTALTAAQLNAIEANGVIVPEPSSLLALASLCGACGLVFAVRCGRKSFASSGSNASRLNFSMKMLLAIGAFASCLMLNAGARAANIAALGTGTIGSTANSTLAGDENDHAGSNTAINDGNINTHVDDFYDHTPSGNQEYVGVIFSKPQNNVGSLNLNMAVFVDGGWFGPSGTTPGTGNPLAAADLTAPVVQITTDGVNWTTVGSTSNYVSTMTGVLVGNPNPNISTASTSTFTLSTVENDVLGIRLLGTGGGVAGETDGFIGVGELAVNTVPEPSSIVAWSSLLGAVGLLLAIRRRRPTGPRRVA